MRRHHLFTYQDRIAVHAYPLRFCGLPLGINSLYIIVKKSGGDGRVPGKMHRDVPLFAIAPYTLEGGKGLETSGLCMIYWPSSVKEVRILSGFTATVETNRLLVSLVQKGRNRGSRMWYREDGLLSRLKWVSGDCELIFTVRCWRKAIRKTKAVNGWIFVLFEADITALPFPDHQFDVWYLYESGYDIYSLAHHSPNINRF